MTLVDDFSSDEAIDLLQRFGNVGHWQIQLEDNTLFWSDEVFRIHGLDPSKGVPDIEDAIKFYHPSDRENVQNEINACVETGEPFRFTHRLNRADGYTVMVESVGRLITADDGTPMRILGVFRNVTELTTVQTIVRQMESLQESSGVAFFSYDIKNDMPYWSPELYKLLGYDPVTHVPTMESLIDVFHHDDQLRVQEAMDAAIASGDQFSYDARVMRRDRRVMTCACVGTVTRDEHDVKSHVFGTFQMVED